MLLIPHYLMLESRSYRIISEYHRANILRVSYLVPIGVKVTYGSCNICALHFLPTSHPKRTSDFGITVKLALLQGIAGIVTGVQADIIGSFQGLESKAHSNTIVSF